MTARDSLSRDHAKADAAPDTSTSCGTSAGEEELATAFETSTDGLRLIGLQEAQHWPKAASDDWSGKRDGRENSGVGGGVSHSWASASWNFSSKARSEIRSQSSFASCAEPRLEGRPERRAKNKFVFSLMIFASISRTRWQS